MPRRQFLRATAATSVAVGAGGLLAACSGPGTAQSSTVTGAKPKRGGNMKVGLTGGSSADTINIQNVTSGTFFGQNYLQWDFAQDYYPYSPYLAQVAYSMLSSSPFNETHTNNPHYTNLYNQANAAASPSLRKELLYEMQEFDFNQGGYIIPAFVDSLDAYSDKIGGYTQARVDEPLSNFEYENFYFV